MQIEITLSNIPRENVGYYITRNHYQRHIISIALYLGKWSKNRKYNGLKLELTALKSDTNSLKFARFFNYT